MLNFKYSVNFEYIKPYAQLMEIKLKCMYKKQNILETNFLKFVLNEKF